MDEVFLIGHAASPSTKGKDPAEVFAKAVNDMYGHIVKKRGPDDADVGRPADRRRALRLRRVGGLEEQHLAGDLHDPEGHHHLRLALREARDSYPSVQMFLDKGFRVLPTSWKDVEASRALIEQSLGLKEPRVLGHLFPTWSSQPTGGLAAARRERGAAGEAAGQPLGETLRDVSGARYFAASFCSRLGTQTSRALGSMVRASGSARSKAARASSRRRAVAASPRTREAPRRSSARRRPPPAPPRAPRRCCPPPRSAPRLLHAAEGRDRRHLEGAVEHPHSVLDDGGGLERLEAAVGIMDVRAQLVSGEVGDADEHGAVDHRWHVGLQARRSRCPGGQRLAGDAVGARLDGRRGEVGKPAVLDTTLVDVALHALSC